MPLRASHISGDVRINGQAADPNRDLFYADCVSLGPTGGSVSIDDNGVPAAWVSSTPPSASNGSPPPAAPYVSTYSPPTQSLYLIYYRYSYRWQLKTTGGSTGVRI
jgi:hypothetical protein